MVKLNVEANPTLTKMIKHSTNGNDYFLPYLFSIQKLLRMIACSAIQLLSVSHLYEGQVSSPCQKLMYHESSCSCPLRETWHFVNRSWRALNFSFLSRFTAKVTLLNWQFFIYEVFLSVLRVLRLYSFIYFYAFL